MNHRRPLLFLIAALALLVLGNAAYRTIYPIEPPTAIDELWTDAQYIPPLVAPCPIDPQPTAPNPLKPQWKADA